MLQRSRYLNGRIKTIAGTGIGGYNGDEIDAGLAQLNGPAGIGFDKGDNLYIAEIHNNRVRRVDAKTGIITTVAGCGECGFGGDGGLATCAKLHGPEGVFIDTEDNLYIADTYNHRIRKVNGRTGIISTIAGCGESGYNGEQMSACEAKLNEPSGVVVDSQGNVYFNDYRNDRIRRIDKKGMISTYAGTGVNGYSGDGRIANQAQVNDVYGLGIDQDDNLYIMDSLNCVVRKVDARTQIISTIVGKGTPGQVVEFSSIPDSYIGRVVYEKGTIGMEAPHAVEVTADGNLLIADTGHHRIRMVDFKENTVYTVAGNGEEGYQGDGSSALEASICVHGIRVNSLNQLCFVDFCNNVVREVE